VGKPWVANDQERQPMEGVRGKARGEMVSAVGSKRMREAVERGHVAGRRANQGQPAVSVAVDVAVRRNSVVMPVCCCSAAGASNRAYRMRHQTVLIFLAA
jgi:hypothetical protein